MNARASSHRFPGCILKALPTLLVALALSLLPRGALSYQWYPATTSAGFSPRDGAGAVTLGGKMWLLGGWTPVTTSEVWSSVDGITWTLETVAPWEPRHTAGYVVYANRMWIVGGDANLGHYQNDVWNSEDGVNWTQVSASVPWAPRVLHYTVVFDGRIWVMGGQTLPQFAPAPEVFYNDVWWTTDGITWTCVTLHAPWAPRGMIGGSVVLQGRMWLLGGGTYQTPGHPVRDFYHDVWSSADGVNWTRELASAPWEPRQYHDVAVFGNRMWVMDGWHDRNLNDVWSSTDGITWQERPGTPWPPRHAASLFVHQGSLWVAAGNMWNDVWRLVGPTEVATPAPAASLRLSLRPSPVDPARGPLVIGYDVPAPGGPVSLGVYDATGRRVRMLARTWAPAGHHELEWNGRNDSGVRVPDGVYVLRYDARGSALVEKVVVAQATR